MTDFADGKIQIFAGPQELGAADNLEQVIVDFIGEAKHTLDIAVQELDSELIAQAIIDASWRGVNIRMFMEQDYLARKKPHKLSIRVGETKDEALARTQWMEYRRPASTKTNRDILAALLRNGIDVKADLNPKIFHQKFIVRDYRRSKRSTSAIMTGSTNFTHTGTHKNLNHVIIFHSYLVCKPYLAEFEELRSGTFGELNVREKDQPKMINLGGVPVRILFAPDHAPELEIIKQMLKASKRLDFAVFTFSGSSGIDDAMIILRKAGLDVSGAMDPTQGKHWWAATEWLHNQDIKIFFPKKQAGFGKLHHKLMVIDDDIVIAGSMNYTKPANEFNDENIFVLGSPYDLSEKHGGPVDHDACAEIANYFRDEIKRIIENSDPYQPD